VVVDKSNSAVETQVDLVGIVPSDLQGEEVEESVELHFPQSD